MAHSAKDLIARMALRLPPGPGVTIRTDTPIDGIAPSLTATVDLTLELPDGSLFTLHYPPMELRLPNQPRWDGYRVEFFGIQAPEPPTGWGCSTWTLHEIEDLPPGLPALGTIPLLRQWVRYQDAPIYAQILQFPGRGVAQASFQVVDPSYTQEDLLRASEGLDLLRQFERSRRGRPPRFEDRDDFIAAAFPLIQNAERPSLGKIASLLFPDVPELKDAKRALARQERKHGWPTHQDLIRDARRAKEKSAN